MVGLLCDVGSSGCCGHGILQWLWSTIGLLVANLLLLMLEGLLGASPPGRVGCFGLTEGREVVLASRVRR